MRGDTAFSASYPAARNAPHLAADVLWPFRDCGFAKRSWLHSFITTYCVTSGYLCASLFRNAAKRPGPAGSYSSLA